MQQAHMSKSKSLAESAAVCWPLRCLDLIFNARWPRANEALIFSCLDTALALLFFGCNKHLLIVAYLSKQ
eukprot:4052587-Amphidinium_carterae.1